MTTNKTLDQLFNTPQQAQEVTIIGKNGDVILQDEVESQDKQLETDYNAVRNNLHGLMHHGNEALEYALHVAKSTDNPRAFEVVGTLIKQMSEVNTTLLDVHDKRTTIEGKRKSKGAVEKPAGGGDTINNTAVFVGSTAELNAMLEKMRNKG